MKVKTSISSVPAIIMMVLLITSITTIHCTASNIVTLNINNSTRTSASGRITPDFLSMAEADVEMEYVIDSEIKGRMLDGSVCYTCLVKDGRGQPFKCGRGEPYCGPPRNRPSSKQNCGRYTRYC